MGILGKILGEKRVTEEDYIDLEKYAEKSMETQPELQRAKMCVRVGEIQRYEDLKTFLDYVYGGNVLILDFSPLAEEEVILKRITSEIKKAIKDIDGDVAGIGGNLMVLTPSGVKIDRKKLRGGYA
ncbi:MAG TPA: DUF552 domain-containing protein [Thermoplasmatales archaeon]|nr:DUF552 domain-containing protein [Thermoplasmatales archaeon]HEX16983.1 DUF552 domain-containing protein [Thermoplasmatales archaeon]